MSLLEVFYVCIYYLRYTNSMSKHF